MICSTKSEEHGSGKMVDSAVIEAMSGSDPVVYLQPGFPFVLPEPAKHVEPGAKRVKLASKKKRLIEERLRGRGVQVRSFAILNETS